jgi:hypothetical protein
METTTNERLNDVHEWQPVDNANGVPVHPNALRRLHRLHARLEFAQELVQQANAQFQETLLGIFEDAGVQASPKDGFHIDWRGGTVSLRRGEASDG